jgi:hypothetical protein
MFFSMYHNVVLPTHFFAGWELPGWEYDRSRNRN